MSLQSASTRWIVVRAVAAAVGAAIALIVFVFGGGFIYNHWYNVPDLTYTVLPSYQVEGVSFAGLVVENRGRTTAHEVLINLGDLHTNIQQYSVDSQELWTQRGGGTAEATLLLWLDRMASGSSLTVYLLTDGEARLDDLGVTAEEGPGHLAADQPTTSILQPVGAVFALSGASVVIVLLGSDLIRTVARQLDERRSGKRTPPAPKGRS